MAFLEITAPVRGHTRSEPDLESALFHLAINFGALNNLLQMFSNNMNLNGNKPSLLPPPGPGASSNMNLSSQHGSNQSLNVQDQQQHALNSPRPPPPPNPNNGTYNNESSLLMCGTGPYNGGGPSPNSTGGPPATHHNQSGGLTPSVAAPGNNPYPPTIPSLYTNNGSPLSNGGAGTASKYFFQNLVFDLDAHHNLQNLVAMSQVNNGGNCHR
jgi:hypothetical protein